MYSVSLASSVCIQVYPIYSFFGLDSSTFIVSRKNFLSINLRPSSMKLGFILAWRLDNRGGESLHDRETDNKNRLPFSPVERQDGEESLQDWSVEKSEVECHGQSDCIDQHHILPQRKSEE